MQLLCAHTHTSTLSTNMFVIFSVPELTNQMARLIWRMERYILMTKKLLTILNWLKAGRLRVLNDRLCSNVYVM